MLYTDIFCMSGRQLRNAGKKASDIVRFTCFILLCISPYHVTAAPKEFGTPIDNTMYKLASQYDDASAQYLVGRNFLYGKTVARDTAEALKWLKRAADQNHKRALYALGKIYLYGENEIKIDKKKGINYLILAAKKGLSEAQYDLGMHYLNAETNLKINKEAQKWLRFASEQNNSRAQLALGKLLLDQKGHEKEAKEWLSSAAEAGELVAAKLLKAVTRVGTTAIAMHHEETKAQQDSKTVVTHSSVVTNESVSGEDVPENILMSNVALENKETSSEEQFQLGLDYFNGDRGLPKKTDKGLEYLRLAAERNHVDAQHSLGMILGGGLGVKEDYDESIKWLKLAQKGGVKSVKEELDLIKFKQLLADEGKYATDPKTQFDLANHYLTGEGVEKNFEMASKWFLEAAEQGHHEAQFEIAKMYKNGEGLSQNIESAKHWLIKASEGGVKPAERLLQDIYAQESAPAKVSSAANDGDVAATQDAGLNTANNSTDPAIELDSPEPVSLTPKATNITLTTSLTEKTIPTINVDEQLEIHDFSGSDKVGGDAASIIDEANRGDVNAQYTLGLKLLNREGTKQDAVEGAKWVLLAANNKHIKAQLQLGDLYLRGEKIEKDYAKAFQWFERAAIAGEPKAQLALGDMYKKGIGVERSNVRAIKWYRESANQGNSEAQKRLGGCRVC